MTTRGIVDAAPAPPAPEPPAGGTTHPHVSGRSEAMIVVSVLAEHAGPMGCIQDLPDNLVAALVERFLAQHDHAYVLGWRARVPCGQWGVRWDVGRRLAERLYATLPGVRAVPDVYAAYDIDDDDAATIGPQDAPAAACG